LKENDVLVGGGPRWTSADKGQRWEGMEGPNPAGKGVQNENTQGQGADKLDVGYRSCSRKGPEQGHGRTIKPRQRSGDFLAPGPRVGTADKRPGAQSREKLTFCAKGRGWAAAERIKIWT